MSTMRNYESTIIINGMLEDDAVNQVVNRTAEFITRNGGTVEETNHWGRRRMAYTIDKKTSGYYVQFTLKAVAEFAPQLERFYFLEEQIIRSLTLQLDERTLRRREESKARMAEIAAEDAARAAEAAAAEGRESREREPQRDRDGGRDRERSSAPRAEAEKPAGE